MTTYGTIPTSSSPAGTNLEYISRAKARLSSHLATRRPWKEILNYRSITLPSSLSDSIGRIRFNIAYFAMNYIIVALLILFLSLLWHPISLIVFIVMMVAWLFLYFLRDDPLVILNRRIDDRFVVIVLAVLTLVFLFLTDATVNILIAVLIAVVLVVVHAVFRRTDDLSFDEGGGALYAGIPSSSTSS